MGMKIRIPPAVQAVLLRLEQAGYEAYAVGGCVRDSLLGQVPQDWDICTSALPDQIQACFSHCILTGVKYGTVTVIKDGVPYEVTTFRAEEEYRDSRHPESVRFLTSLYGDLARRDFSINAMAADARGNVTDEFDGLHDLRHGLIRCVGEPEERFGEDALRILRALRFASRLEFRIEPNTARGIHSLYENLGRVSPERLRKELSGLLMGKGAVAVLEEYADVLSFVVPELKPCIGFEQHNPHHRYDVFRHSLWALFYSPQEESLRLAALLHDIGKPDSFQQDEQGIGHFYGHSERSAALCRQALQRLRYDNKTIELVTELVRNHDLCLQPLSEKRLRRLLSQWGEDFLRKLFLLRRADALGTGVAEPKEVERKTTQLMEQLEELLAREGRFQLRDLAINGNDLIALGILPGKQLGRILNQLFEAVVEEECPNNREELVRYAQTKLIN